MRTCGLIFAGSLMCLVVAVHCFSDDRPIAGPPGIGGVGYDGTTNSYEKIITAVMPAAEDGNLLAICIARQAMMALGQSIRMERLSYAAARRLDPKVLETWLSFIKAKAEGGDLFFTDVLATCYHFGYGFDKDADRGLGLWKEAADKNYGLSLLKLGNALRGSGKQMTPEVTQRVTELYEKAAAVHQPVALYNLGCLYAGFDQTPFVKDMDKASQYFAEAATIGHPIAQRNLGILYMNEAWPKSDFRQGMFWFKTALANGDVGAASWINNKGVRGGVDVEKSVPATRAPSSIVVPAESIPGRTLTNSDRQLLRSLMGPIHTGNYNIQGPSLMSLPETFQAVQISTNVGRLTMSRVRLNRYNTGVDGVRLLLPNDGSGKLTLFLAFPDGALVRTWILPDAGQMNHYNYTGWAGGECSCPWPREYRMVVIDPHATDARLRIASGSEKVLYLELTETNSVLDAWIGGVFLNECAFVGASPVRNQRIALFKSVFGCSPEPEPVQEFYRGFFVGHVGMMKTAVEKGAPLSDIWQKYASGLSFIAARSYRPEVVNFLLERNCSFDARYSPDTSEDWNPVDAGLDPVRYAIAGGNVGIVKEFMEHGYSLPTDAVRYAVPSRSTNMLAFLISKGCDVNARDRRGTPPLMVACLHSHSNALEMVKMLVENGGDVEVKDNRGKTVYDTINSGNVTSVTIKDYLLEVRRNRVGGVQEGKAK